jgi:hypothetical protein
MKLLAQATNPFGNVKMPYVPEYDLCGTGGGPTLLVSNIIKIAMVGAGLFAFINLIIAGFLYVSSNGDPKKTAAAWQKIYMSLIGLLIMVASFALTIIISEILFGEPMAILSPTIYGPGEGVACP